MDPDKKIGFTSGELSIKYQKSVSTVIRLLDQHLAHRLLRVGRTRVLPTQHLPEFEKLLAG